LAKRRQIENPLGLVVLAYLSQGPTHPYELSSMLAERDGARSVRFSHGSVYAVIRQLERAGFIAALETTREGRRPERTSFCLTDSGSEELTSWLSNLIQEPQPEYPQFLTALSLVAALPPSTAVELLSRRLSHLAAARAEICAFVSDTLATGVNPIFLIEEEFRLALLDAEVDFVRRFIDQITEKKTEWSRQWAEFHGEETPAGEQEKR
jgi:DNA-binding PadR family transcriptional regulator